MAEFTIRKAIANTNVSKGKAISSTQNGNKSDVSYLSTAENLSGILYQELESQVKSKNILNRFYQRSLISFLPSTS